MFAMAVIFQFGLNLQYLDFFQNCPSLKQLKLEAKVDLTMPMLNSNFTQFRVKFEQNIEPILSCIGREVAEFKWSN